MRPLQSQRHPCVAVVGPYCRSTLPQCYYARRHPTPFRAVVSFSRFIIRKDPNCSIWRQSNLTIRVRGIGRAFLLIQGGRAETSKRAPRILAVSSLLVFSSWTRPIINTTGLSAYPSYLAPGKPYALLRSLSSHTNQLVNFD